MQNEYLLIESRDPFDTSEVANNYELAANLAAAGHSTTMFLVQNGVLATRSAARGNGLHALLRSGVNIICDEFSLRERGIYSSAMMEGVTIGPLDIVVEQLATNCKTIWL